MRSELGQTRKSSDATATSDLPLKADINRTSREVREVPARTRHSSSQHPAACRPTRSSEVLGQEATRRMRLGSRCLVLNRSSSRKHFSHGAGQHSLYWQVGTQIPSGLIVASALTGQLYETYATTAVDLTERAWDGSDAFRDSLRGPAGPV